MKRIDLECVINSAAMTFLAGGIASYACSGKPRYMTYGVVAAMGVKVAPKIIERLKLLYDHKNQILEEMGEK